MNSVPFNSKEQTGNLFQKATKIKSLNTKQAGQKLTTSSIDFRCRSWNNHRFSVEKLSAASKKIHGKKTNEKNLEKGREREEN